MSRRLVRLRIAVLVLTVALVAPWASASQPLRQAERSARSTSVPAPWNLLEMVWSLLTGSQTENGCSLDPNGGCIGQPATTTSDNGCSADPNGTCIVPPVPSGSTPTPKNGCSADPDGRCISGH
jgi:hypothetical protein